MKSAMGAGEIADQLQGRHVLDIADFTCEEIAYLLDLASVLKAKREAGEASILLPGRTLGMLFMKKSTRTRISFEVGIYELGGVGLFLSASDLQLGHGETIRDTAETASRYLSAIMIRSVAHAEVVEFAAYATIPVINGMTNEAHPCQTLADLLTMRQYFGTLAGLKVVYLGAGLNVGCSLMLGCTKMGVDFRMCCPAGFEPPLISLDLAAKFAHDSGGSLQTTQDPWETVAGADVVYTDGWTPPELEEQHEARRIALRPYAVEKALLSASGEQARVMHCLPAHYGEEITEEVIHGPQSLVFDQAENRLHVQKAVMATIVP